MEWLSNGGEIYHRRCTAWTASFESGTCQKCGEPIPDSILHRARDATEERVRRERGQTIQRSLRSTAQRLAALQSKMDTSVRLQSRTEQAKKD